MRWRRKGLAGPPGWRILKHRNTLNLLDFWPEWASDRSEKMKRLFLICTLAAACAPGLPGPGGGARSVAPRSGATWDAEHLKPDPIPAGPSAVATPELIARRNALT